MPAPAPRPLQLSVPNHPRPTFPKSAGRSPQAFTDIFVYEDDLEQRAKVAEEAKQIAEEDAALSEQGDRWKLCETDLADEQEKVRNWPSSGLNWADPELG